MMVEKYRRTQDKYFCQNCKDRNWIVNVNVVVVLHC